MPKLRQTRGRPWRTALASRLNPYQGAPNREGYTPPAWGTNNFAQWFRPTSFTDLGSSLAPATAPARANGVLSGGESDAGAEPFVSGPAIRPSSALNQPDQGGEATTSPTGGPTPASEGGRAFAEGSPFSGLSGRGINTALSLANTALGLPAMMGIPALGFPLAVARAAENLSNFAFNPATSNLQMAFQSLFGTTPTVNSLNAATGVNNFAGTSPALAAQRAGERAELSPRPNDPIDTTAPPATPEAPPDITNSPDAGIGGPSGPGSAGAASAGTSADAASAGTAAGGEMARGGMVRGPQTPVDAVPARLTGGEFVTNPYATRAFRPLLEVLNQAVTDKGVNRRALQMLGFLPAAR